MRDLITTLALVGAWLTASTSGDVNVAGPAVAIPIMMAVAGATKIVTNMKVASAQAKQSRYNRQVALQAAAHERRILAEKVTDRRRQASILSGAQRAAIGASGIAADTGSTALLLEDTAMLAEMDVMRLESNSAMEVWGLEQKGQQFENEARLAKYSAKMGAISTGVSTATSIMGARANLGGSTWSGGPK